MQQTDIRSALLKLATEYPPEMVAEQRESVERIAFNIGLALDGCRLEDTSICDIGGGVGLFSIGCKAIGCRRSVLVDDFGDDVNRAFGEPVLEPHRRRGVEIVSRDVISAGLGTAGPFDVVTTFDSMEHWHHSPKPLFKEIVHELKPGGRFVLGVPNCVNLRKRITVPLGYGKWSSFEEWYGVQRFRGHVREPDVADLRSIANDMKLKNVRIVGMNWTGYASPSRLVRAGTRLVDVPLRLFPTLCGDIYLVGEKPRGT